MRVPELEAQDNGLPVDRPQARERPDESVGSLHQDRLVFRRRRFVGNRIGKFERDATTAKAAADVANAIDHRLAQIMLQGVDTMMFELRDAFECAQHGILEHVVGVYPIAPAAWNAAVRPPAQRRECAFDQNPQRRSIALLRAR